MRFFCCVLLGTLLVMSASEATPQSLPPGHAPNLKLASAYGTELSPQVMPVAQKTSSVATNDGSLQGLSSPSPASCGSHTKENAGSSEAFQ